MIRRRSAPICRHFRASPAHERLQGFSLGVWPREQPPQREHRGVPVCPGGRQRSRRRCLGRCCERGPGGGSGNGSGSGGVSFIFFFSFFSPSSDLEARVQQRHRERYRGRVREPQQQAAAGLPGAQAGELGADASERRRLLRKRSRSSFFLFLVFLVFVFLFFSAGPGRRRRVLRPGLQEALPAAQREQREHRESFGREAEVEKRGERKEKMQKGKK